MIPTILPSRLHRVLGASLLLFLAPAAAWATQVTLDFNTVQLGSTSYGNGLGHVGGNTNIDAYIESMLDAAGLTSADVTVTGALATATYNGEGHVVGETLGTSDNGVHHATPNDIFIINNNFGIGASAANAFTFAFTGFNVFSVAFDWEIFPNASCPTGSTCANAGNTNANWPDISLLLNGSSTPVWRTLATIPGAGKDPQGLGHATLDFQTGAQSLTFKDWPAEIGIDNLVLTGCVANSPNCLVRPDCIGVACRVPEPSTLPLALLALPLLAYAARRPRLARRASS